MRQSLFTLLMILLGMTFLITGFQIANSVANTKQEYVPVNDSLDIYRIEHNRFRNDISKKETEIIINLNKLAEKQSIN